MGKNGTAFVLQSSELKDENSLYHPMKIVPVEQKLPIPAGEFVYSFMPQSLTVLRLPSR